MITNKTIFLAIICLHTLAFSSCGEKDQSPSVILSLTDDSYTGQKHYLGFGSAMQWDPELMHNEVHYDVMHTHDIFTSGYGGDYNGRTHIGPYVQDHHILWEYQNYKATMNPDDMFVQYSSGHGFQDGLAIGLRYSQIRNYVLSLPAKEKIIFTMACHSGGLVDSFNRRRDEWKNYQAEGKTLLVFASSQTHETSSTGPGFDEDEPMGPYGSAGSAFGNALWKALLGYADGYTSRVKDGFLDLDEILRYTTHTTRMYGGHTPVYTGSFNRRLVMNRIPKTFKVANK